ncbi:hypothetical protein K438DRAFT_1853992 [Mycena galopus ATCC 62051]|nr:hypothetical protein K438DRAFT_1853992 [Mycena galopus ATCC 62051]
MDGWEEVADIWDPLFPDYELAANEGLRPIVYKLAEDKINAWRNKFSTTATDVLEEIFNEEDAHTPDARADVVARLLEGNDTNRAFYYRDYADTDGNVIQKGLFQGKLITRGLAAHYGFIRSPTMPVEDPETTEFPETPLVHSIQAGKRALFYNETGKYIVPPHRLGEFSRANWGDKVDFREGRPIHVNTTSGLIAIVRKVKDNLWRKIIKAAVEASLPKKRSAGAKLPVVEDDTVVLQDIELVDNDSD